MSADARLQVSWKRITCMIFIDDIIMIVIIINWLLLPLLPSATTEQKGQEKQITHTNGVWSSNAPYSGFLKYFFL